MKEVRPASDDLATQVRLDMSLISVEDVDEKHQASTISISGQTSGFAGILKIMEVWSISSTREAPCGTLTSSWQTLLTAIC